MSERIKENGVANRKLVESRKNENENWKNN